MAAQRHYARPQGSAGAVALTARPGSRFVKQRQSDTASRWGKKMENPRFDRVKQVVCETLELDPDDVTATSLFVDDHDADSLNLIEILAALEKEFNVVID